MMNCKQRRRASLALMLAAVLLLSGCAELVGPSGEAQSVESAALAEQAAPTPEPRPEGAQEPPRPSAASDAEEDAAAVDCAESVTVSTVDELLAAIAPETQILLEPGLYDLSTAADYGKQLAEGYYTWEEVYDGYQLVIRDVDALAILGGGIADVTISAQPRYANVLAFRNCKAPLVMQLTAGHSQEPGFCAGGVLDFQRCAAPLVLDCALYGCGTIGVNAENCRKLTVRNTDIYECSMGAVWAFSSYDVLVDGCRIYDCGTRDEAYSYCELFTASACTGFTLLNCDITDNAAEYLLDSRYSRQVKLLGCGVQNNRIRAAAFLISGAPPIVDGCAFKGNRPAGYYPDTYSGYAVDLDGNDLISFDLDRMQRREAGYAPPAALDGSPAADGRTTEYHVKTVDEFLAAIGPDTTIYLDAEQFDLSTASSYGGYGSQYYFWESCYDGPSLVISGVSNLRIVGQGKDKTEILAIPRFADVLCFIGGENIALEGFTAGHTDTGDCTGDVLGFESVTNISIRDCGLFGCGVWGLRANNCWNVEVADTEIYSCSSGAFTMYQCENVKMSGMDIHDMPERITAYIGDCTNFDYDGLRLGDGGHKLGN